MHPLTDIHKASLILWLVVNTKPRRPLPLLLLVLRHHGRLPVQARAGGQAEAPGALRTLCRLLLGEHVEPGSQSGPRPLLLAGIQAQVAALSWLHILGPKLLGPAAE